MLLILASDSLGAAPPGWGSHILVQWRDFEPNNDMYRLDTFTNALERSDRPCYVQLGFSFLDKPRNAPVDFTPRQHKRSIRLQVDGRVGEIPPYDATWTDAYCRAVEALAFGLRDRDQVLGYWHAAGWNTETQAAVAIRGNDWAAAAKPLLDPARYYAFITASTQRAVAAWGEKPVYLPGATSPGSVWGVKRRDIIVDALRAGAGYLCAGLASDNSTSFGVGERSGQGMYDIAWETTHVGFEEGQRLSPNEPMELYWMLLRARHWQAKFVNLYGSISAPQAAEIVPLLPAENARWIVFRDAEYPQNAYISGGKVYGYSGELGDWGSGIRVEGAESQRGADGFGFDRWVLETSGVLILQLPGAADGAYQVTAWHPDGSRYTYLRDVVAERLTLPAGRYHRVDVLEAPELTLDERVRRLEVRVDELAGAMQAGK